MEVRGLFAICGLPAKLIPVHYVEKLYPASVLIIKSISAPDVSMTGNISHMALKIQDI